MINLLYRQSIWAGLGAWVSKTVHDVFLAGRRPQNLQANTVIMDVERNLLSACWSWRLLCMIGVTSFQSKDLHHLATGTTHSPGSRRQRRCVFGGSLNVVTFGCYNYL